MSMHESYLLVCRPYFNTMMLWTLDPNLHLSPADTTFCLFLCFFPFLLICLLSPLVVCPYPYFYACHIYLACSLFILLLLCSHFPSLLVCWFSCFCLFMYTYGARTHGARAWSLRCKQKGHRCKHAEQLHLLGLGFSFSLLLCILYTPLFLFPFPLRWSVLGISCCIPFVLISRVWRPLFTFLHLYLGHALGM